MKNWKSIKDLFRNNWASLRRHIRKIGDVLSVMKVEAKKQLPSWKADADAAVRVWHLRFLHYRDSFRIKTAEWKATFLTLDTSREKMHQMLFEDKTALGRLFESLLMVAIVLSVLLVIIDSIDAVHRRFVWLTDILEWTFTILFTIEYLLRLYSARRPFRYATSFFGIIDLVTILPTYISYFVVGAHTFLVLRILRVFRIFRLLKLVKLLKAGNTIMASLKASKEKIAIFLVFILLVVTMMGSILYIVEAGQDSGFTSIPVSIYWAIVTLTTVGYGDIAPATWQGQFIAAIIMITGYAVIAVPTGIVSAEFVNETRKANYDMTPCPRCGKDGHEQEARYCNRCAERLAEEVKNIG
ncbi:MAG: ion transporter [Bacteroidales bacterium]|nr:ion transporter [Bacteroidales bacterium]